MATPTKYSDNILDLPWSVRTRNVFAKNGIKSIGDVCRYRHEELSVQLVGIGITVANEIKSVLESRGFRLGQRDALEFTVAARMQTIEFLRELGKSCLETADLLERLSGLATPVEQPHDTLNE